MRTSSGFLGLAKRWPGWLHDSRRLSRPVWDRGGVPRFQIEVIPGKPLHRAVEDVLEVEAAVIFFDSKLRLSDGGVMALRSGDGLSLDEEDCLAEFTNLYSVVRGAAARPGLSSARGPAKEACGQGAFSLHWASFAKVASGTKACILRRFIS